MTGCVGHEEEADPEGLRRRSNEELAIWAGQNRGVVPDAGLEVCDRGDRDLDTGPAHNRLVDLDRDDIPVRQDIADAVPLHGRLTAHEAALTGFFGTVGLYDQTTDDQHQRADDLLQQVGLAERRDLRFGLLSTGEQRRCLIARALVQPPQLLILDEPTAGLDITGREQVLATIEMVLSRPNPPTVLFITHHVEELSPRTEQVLLMRQGRFIMTGTPDQVITPETLSETFGCKIYVSKSGGRFWPQVLPEAWLDLIDPAQRGDDKTGKD